MSEDPSMPGPSSDLERLIRRTEGLQLGRRLFHLAGGVVLAWMVHVLSPEASTTRWLFAGGLAVALLLDAARLTSERVNAMFFRILSALASPREAERIASSTWYLVGVLIVLLGAPGAYVVPSILVLAAADPAASVVGRVWGRHQLGKGTVQGSGAFLLVAFVVLYPFAGLGLAAVAAAVVAAIEILPTRLDDNLVIPVATAASLWVFSGLF